MRIRYILSACIALCLVFSCAKIERPEEYVTLYVTASLDTAQTRTHLEYVTADGKTVGKVRWSDKDYEMFKFYNADWSVGIIAKEIIINKENASTATFTFDIPKAVARSLNDCDNYFYYGKQSIKWNKDNYPDSIILAAKQVYAANSFSEGANISMGCCVAGNTTTDANNNYEMNCVMRNVFGILKVDITFNEEVAIHRIHLTDNDENGYLAGKYSLTGIKDGTPSLTRIPVNNVSETHTIEYMVGSSTPSTTGSYYFLVPPGKLCSNAGFNIVAYTGDGQYAGKTVKNLDGKMSIERSKISPVEMSLTVKTIPVNDTLTANCYIIPNIEGFYSIPADYKGNGYQGNGDDIGQRSNSIEYSNLMQAALLWQTKCNTEVVKSGELIKDVVYFTKNSRRYIGFRTTGAKGNALVALRKDDGTILWSWHLWITDEVDKINRGFSNNNTATAVTIMDRNLGALYFDPTSAGSQAHGLAYQYGRKDPFMGAGEVKVAGVTGDASFAAIFPTYGIDCENLGESMSSSFTIGYSTMHPTTRSLRGEDSWCTETVKWGENEQNKPKTLYDPCPAGWRVMEGKTLESFIASASNLVVVMIGSQTTGWNAKVSCNGDHFFFPSAGYSANNKQISYVGNYASFWCSDYKYDSKTKKSTAYSYDFRITGEGGYEQSYSDRYFSVTMPVRCQKYTEPALPTGK